VRLQDITSAHRMEKNVWPTELSDTALVMSSEVRRNGQIKNQPTKEKGSGVNESFTNAPTSSMQAGGLRVPVLPKSRHAISHTNSHANPDPPMGSAREKISNARGSLLQEYVGPHEHTRGHDRNGKSDSRSGGRAPRYQARLVYVLREGGDNLVPEGECGKGR